MTRMRRLVPMIDTYETSDQENEKPQQQVNEMSEQENEMSQQHLEEEEQRETLSLKRR